MEKHISGRVLAIGLRTQRFGYAVFEETDLIECGVRHYGTIPRYRLALLKRRLAFLIHLFTPDLVIVCTPATKHLASLRRAVEIIKKELRRNGVRSEWIRNGRVMEHYLRYGAASKHEIATIIANRIPELRPLVIPKRKLWENEHHRSPVWDATAAGVYYLGTERFGLEKKTRESYLS
jgi:hypothetical protein